jgi:fluoroacetyl-CoA thioesterase
MLDLRNLVSIGQSATVEKNVTKADTAVNFGTGRLGEIMATPALVKLMIKAAVEAVDTKLPDGLGTIGQALQFIHTAPSLVGASVRVQAKVTQIIGDSVILEITAWDDMGEIGTGHYERSVVILDEVLKKAIERAFK